MVIDSRHYKTLRTEPVHDSADPAPSDVGQVHRPDLIGSGDRPLAQEIGTDLVGADFEVMGRR